MRHNHTERLGVIETDKIFTKEFHWIFREQPVVDVGIDAIIEESINFNPSGRFIAAQIKTGLGNFHSSSKSLTYYVSNIHYNYWLGLVLPPILIAYLPDTDELLWQIISKDTLKKTPTKWKIEISRSKVLNVSAKPDLTKILDLKFRYVAKRMPLQGDPLELDIYDIVENINYIKDSANSTVRFINILKEMSDLVKNNVQKITSFASLGYSVFDNRVIAVVNKFAQDLIAYAKRIKNETDIFTESFGLGFSSYIQATTIYYSLTKNESELEETKNTFVGVAEAIIKAENGLIIMQNSIRKLPNTYPKLKAARNKLVETLNVVIDEYKIAKEFLNQSFV